MSFGITKWFSAGGGDFAPRGDLAMLETFLLLMTEERVLLTPSRKRPASLLNTLHCPERPLIAEN